MGGRVADLKPGGGAPARARGLRRRVRTRGTAGASRGIAGSRGDAMPSVPRMAQKENMNPNLSRLAKVMPPPHSQGVPFERGGVERLGVTLPVLEVPRPWNVGVSGWPLDPHLRGHPQGGSLGPLPPKSLGGGPHPWGGLGAYPGSFWGAGGHDLSLEGVGVSFGGVAHPWAGCPPVIPPLPAVRGAGPSGPPAAAPQRPARLRVPRLRAGPAPESRRPGPWQAQGSARYGAGSGGSRGRKGGGQKGSLRRRDLLGVGGPDAWVSWGGVALGREIPSTWFQ